MLPILGLSLESEFCCVCARGIPPQRKLEHPQIRPEFSQLAPAKPVSQASVGQLYLEKVVDRRCPTNVKRRAGDEALYDPRNVGSRRTEAFIEIILPVVEVQIVAPGEKGLISMHASSISMEWDVPKRGCFTPRTINKTVGVEHEWVVAQWTTSFYFALLGTTKQSSAPKKERPWARRSTKVVGKPKAESGPERDRAVVVPSHHRVMDALRTRTQRAPNGAFDDAVRVGLSEQAASELAINAIIVVDSMPPDGQENECAKSVRIGSHSSDAASWSLPSSGMMRLGR
ncbi:uncharacterized protein STEHIDRAFT_107845 [Stereum hirsutum FP-91666 SS1]|uniref:uncharacterized protein n=1 Tax=Stereum hirsutum (strain FP-91666) TaxID=721885 RepID=UPI000440B409|nr:uncharacterized protein STEHIDRAFT_107845 [Stereum hirsutum FP-91666 SS1]EIM91251.1 hypothetical protein STEHIDRAFT_107845 [Stereum hirsutum FP-91666 SS1]